MLFQTRIFSIFFLLTNFALADSFTLHNDSTGMNYKCGPGGGHTTDPACTKDVADYCGDSTAFGREDCFNRAAEACHNGATPECVRETSDYCHDNTALGREDCFNRAVETCSGNARGIKSLIDAAKLKK